MMAQEGAPQVVEQGAPRGGSRGGSPEQWKAAAEGTAAAAYGPSREQDGYWKPERPLTTMDWMPEDSFGNLRVWRYFIRVDTE